MKMLRNRKFVFLAIMAMLTGVTARFASPNPIVLLIAIIIFIPIVWFMARMIFNSRYLLERRIREWHEEFGDRNNANQQAGTRGNDDMNLEEWP